MHHRQRLLWVWGVSLAACVAHPTQHAEQAEQANATAATPHKVSCQVGSEPVFNTLGTVFLNHKTESAIFESLVGNESSLLPMVPAPSLEFSGMHASTHPNFPTQLHITYYDN
jgi:hypothetical protein